jgi:hypothetical protein
LVSVLVEVAIKLIHRLSQLIEESVGIGVVRKVVVESGVGSFDTLEGTLTAAIVW